MKEGEDGIEHLYACPKCDTPVVLTRLTHHEVGGDDVPRTEGIGIEALDHFFLNGGHLGDTGARDFIDLNAFHDIVILACKECRHIFGMIPTGARSITDAIFGLDQTACDEIEAAKLWYLAAAKSVLAELRKRQFLAGEEYEGEHEEVVDSDQSALDIQSPDHEEIVKRMVEAFAAAAEATLERQLAKAADRLAANLSTSIAQSVASAFDKRLAALEERLAQNGDQHRNGPIPVRIQEIDPEATIRVEDDGREKEVRVINTPLDVRQLPG